MTVPPDPLCGYDVFRQRTSPRSNTARPPCRCKATHRVACWLDDEDASDLFLCAPHAAALTKLHPGDDVDAERIREAA